MLLFPISSAPFIGLDIPVPPRKGDNIPALISWALCVWVLAAAPTCAAVVLCGLFLLFKWSISLLIANLILPNSVLFFSPLEIFTRAVASVKFCTWSLGARFGTLPSPTCCFVTPCGFALSAVCLSKSSLEAYTKELLIAAETFSASPMNIRASNCISRMRLPLSGT